MAKLPSISLGQRIDAALQNLLLHVFTSNATLVELLRVRLEDGIIAYDLSIADVSATCRHDVCTAQTRTDPFSSLVLKSLQ